MLLVHYLTTCFVLVQLPDLLTHYAHHPIDLPCLPCLTVLTHPDNLLYTHPPDSAATKSFASALGAWQILQGGWCSCPIYGKACLRD